MSVAINNKGRAGAMSDAEILAAVKRVDGVGSGLDADRLQGAAASAFVAKAAYGAQTILAATEADTPVAMELPEQRLFGRITGGGPAALTAAQARGILGGCDILAALTSAEVSVTTTAALDATAFGTMHACSGTSSNYTVTLPPVSGNGGKWIGLRCVGGLTRVVTVTGSDSGKINGVSSAALIAHDVAILFCTGSEWLLMRNTPHLECTMQMTNGSSNLSVATGTFTTIPLDTVVSETGGPYSDTANYRYTPPAGKYAIIAQAKFVSVPDGTRIIVLLHAGNASAYFEQAIGSANTIRLIAVSPCAMFSGSNHARMQVWHNKGSNLDIAHGSETFLSVVRIA